MAHPNADLITAFYAAFAFRDGRIVTHVDTFDFHRWAGQALGLSGRLAGWAPTNRP